MKRPLLLFFALLFLAACESPEEVEITPTPTQVSARRGRLKTASNWEDRIVYVLDTNLSPEAYCISVGRRGIQVRYRDSHSRLYALTSLRQIRRPDGSFPYCEVEDAPRFYFRAFMLDPCRHFVSVEETRKFLSAMSLYKLNYFHWHLTEDQGWRVEIDMPGHIQSALAAYPFLGCTGGPYRVWDRWGISREVLCPGKESTFAFVDAVLKEVAEMFPGQYIHIGGDEVPLDRWKECPDCRKRMQAEGLKDGEELMSWFINRVCGMVKSYGKTPMLYEEAVMKGGSFPPVDAVIMDAVQGPSKGYTSIMSDYEFTYFDYCQGSHKTEPLSIGGYIPPRKLYGYDPYRGIAPEDKDKVAGLVCYLWTEYITTPEYAEYMSFPRMQVLSELAWSSHAGEDWEKFRKRIISHDYPLMDAMGFSYSHYAEDFPRTHLPLIPYPRFVLTSGGYSEVSVSDAIYTLADSLSSEAYRIRVTADSVQVVFGDEAGLRNARATLSQLPDPLPCMEIADAPARKERSLLLDCTRKTSVEEIQLILNELARYKYNSFIWRTYSLYSEKEMREVEKSSASLSVELRYDTGSKMYEYPFAVPFSMPQGAHERENPYSAYLSAMMLIPLRPMI